MNLERFSTPLFIAAIILAGWVYQNMSSQQYRLIKDETRNKPYVKMDEVFREPRTLWWSGLTGENPKFIANGTLRGLGWQEFPVHNLKKSLNREYNIEISNWYITPTRLEEEFRHHRRPVCFYPYIWSDPEKEFSKKQEFLYSRAIEIDGDDVKNIIVHKNEVHRFIKHFDNNGNLNIESLIADPNLKTKIIAGKRYVPAVSSIITRDQNKNFKIKENFNRQVELMVASTSNKQLLLMLRKKRIDYIFDDLVTLDQLNAPEFADKPFELLPYFVVSIHSAKDKNLRFYSIKCNLHPKNLRIMPLINEYIEKSIGGDLIRVVDHRKKMERQYVNNLGFWEKLDSRIGMGDRNWWFSEYLVKAQVPTVPPFEKVAQAVSAVKQSAIPEPSEPITVSTRPPRQNYGIIMENGRIIIMDYYRLSILQRNRHRFTTMGDESYYGYFFREMNNFIYAFTDEDLQLLQSNELKERNLEDLLKIESANINSLTISSYDVDAAHLVALLNRFRDLRELHLIMLPNQTEKAALKRLPHSLEKLSIIAMDLRGANLQSNILARQLKHLDLTATYLDHDQINQIFDSHRTRLEHLGFGYQKGTFDLVRSVTFGMKPWNKLKVLNLRNSVLSGEEIDNVINGLDGSLQEINLENNYLSSGQVERLMTKCQDLRHYISSRSPLVSLSPKKKLILPPHLESLALFSPHMNPRDFLRVKIPASLKRLEIVNATINDEDLAIIGTQPTPQLKELRLEKNQNSSRGLQSFFKSGVGRWNSNLKILNLASSRVDDDLFSFLSQVYSNTIQINVHDNLLTDVSIPAIASFPALESISINNNFLTPQGYFDLYTGTGHNLVWDVSFYNVEPNHVDQLISRLPARIGTLSIDLGILSDAQFGDFVKHAPNSIDILNLKSDSSSIETYPKLFSQLKNRQIKRVNLSSPLQSKNQWISLINSLPRDLEALQINYFKFGVQKVNKRDLNLLRFPPNIGFFHLSQSQPESIWTGIFQTLPLTTEVFNFGTYSIELFGKIEKLKKLRHINHVNFTRFTRQLMGSSTNALYGFDSAETIQEAFQGSQSILYLVSNISTLKRIKEFQIAPSSLPNRISGIFTIGTWMDDSIIDQIIGLNLSNVRELTLEGSSVTANGMIRLLKAISPNAHTISYQSSPLELKDVDRLIENLPKTLSTLKIRGSNIGALGISKFKAWKKAQEERLDSPVDLFF